mmetsp:Transcript_46094/g.112595  ORF Transcript_46094/g.112595 Transcript_46094/m.112595 type:complete len:81 (-) Transcript_46094:526-768(-)
MLDFSRLLYRYMSYPFLFCLGGMLQDICRSHQSLWCDVDISPDTPRDESSQFGGPSSTLSALWYSREYKVLKIHHDSLGH